MESYQKFIDTKRLEFKSIGFIPTDEINPALFPFQRDAVLWALRKGRACLFEDCGLGKTLQQLEWSRHIVLKENQPVIIVAPLAVAQQTQREGIKFGIDVNICSSQNDVIVGINITNYEKLHKFTGSKFIGVVLDESSILKNMSGVIRNQIINMFSKTPYRLACSATPSPNDYMELGNHAEFMGIMSYSEMLSMFFINDSGDVGKWRLKKHAKEQEFWKWLSSWVLMMPNPSDFGYIQKGFNLPELIYIEHKLPGEKNNFGFFVKEVSTLDERRRVRKESIKSRCEKAAEIINDTDDQWVVWCGLNEEGRLLTELINGAEEVSGSTDLEIRKKRMLDFANGKLLRLVTKPSIGGFGMNWQNANKMAFVGLSDSWEELYQATRRLWRYGQKNIVEAHIIIDEREGKVLDNIKRKDKQARHMIENMIIHTKGFMKKEITNNEEESNIIIKDIIMKIPDWL